MSGSCPTAAPYSLGSISIHVSTLPGGTEGIVLQSSVSFRDTQEDPLPTDPPPRGLGHGGAGSQTTSRWRASLLCTYLQAESLARRCPQP